MNKELWKDIVNYETLYKVSSFGRIKSLSREVLSKGGSFRTLKEKILKQTPDSKGYLTVSLSNKGKVKLKRVHKLVAIAFHNHVPNGYEIVVDHKDGNILNNYESNLQEISNRENSSKDRKGYSSKYVGVSFSKNKWIAKIYIKGKNIHLGSFIKEIEAHEAYQEKLKELS